VRNPYRLPDVLRGILIYSSGDTIASLILDEFTPFRLLGMMVVGGLVYALEIPGYFRWIDRKTSKVEGFCGSLARTGLAVAYFNPLWIARHLLFIQIFSGNPEGIGWSLLRIGVISFAVNIPITLTANYLIQNRIPLKWRFMASATFSALMAVYYALSRALF
jgi:hypothetical protein